MDYLTIRAMNKMNLIDENISGVKNELYGDLKGELKPGYYNTTGKFQPLNGDTHRGWYHYKVEPTTHQRDFILEYPMNVSLRLLTFDAENKMIDRILITNGVFTIPTNCVSFVINIPMLDSVPTGGDPNIPDFDAVRSLYVRRAQTTLNLKALKSTPDVGYYANGGGEFKTGIGWYNFYHTIEASTGKTFTLENSLEEGTVRIIYFKNGAYVSSSSVPTNKPFTIADEYTSFALNMPITGSNPISSFTTFQSKDGFKLSIEVSNGVGLSMVDMVEDAVRRASNVNSNSNSKVLKILTVGNSFSDDSDEYLYAIAKSAGVEIIVGQVYQGGQSLEGHWNNVNGNTASGTYYKWKDGVKTATNSSFLKDIVVDENWDIITFQQRSLYSGKYETFQPYLNNLIAFVKSLGKNSEMKIALHMTWAYATGFVDLSGYSNSQMTMYDAICTSYLKAMEATNIDILIPAGTSIQNARTNSYLQKVGNDLTRDGYHLDQGIGRMIAGLTFFETLIAGRYKKDIFTDVSVVPGSGGTKFLTHLSKIAVKNAVNNPFKITQI